MAQKAMVFQTLLGVLVLQVLLTAAIYSNQPGAWPSCRN